MKNILNFANIEELVLKDNSLTDKLPHLYNEVQTWKLGQLVPALRPMGQKSKLDFLNKLTNEDIAIIQKHLNIPVTVNKLEYTSIIHHKICLEDAQKTLNDINLVTKDFCLYRDADSLYICMFR